MTFDPNKPYAAADTDETAEGGFDPNKPYEVAPSSDTSAPGGASGSWEPETTLEKTGREIKEGVSKAADFAMKPLVPMGRAEREGEAIANSGPTVAESEHPWLTGAKKGIAGDYADTLGIARQLVTSPFGLATAGAGELSEAVPAVSKIVSPLGKIAGTAFAGQGAREAYEGGKSMLEKGATSENEKQLLGGAGQALLGGSALLHGTEIGNADVLTDAGRKRAVTAPVRAAAKGYNMGKAALPYVIPAASTVEGALRAGPIGAAEGAAYGSYAGKRIANLLPEANETIGLPKEEVNLKNLEKGLKPLKDKVSKAQEAFDAYDASRAAGKPTPEKVVSDLEKANQDYMAHKEHIELARKALGAVAPERDLTGQNVEHAGEKTPPVTTENPNVDFAGETEPPVASAKHAGALGSALPTGAKSASETGEALGSAMGAPKSAALTEPHTPYQLPASETGEALGGPALKSPLGKISYGGAEPASMTGEALGRITVPEGDEAITPEKVKSTPGTSMGAEEKPLGQAYVRPRPFDTTEGAMDTVDKALKAEGEKGKNIVGKQSTVDEDNILFQRAKNELPNGTPSDWARRASDMKKELPKYRRPNPFETTEGAHETLARDKDLAEFYRREGDVKPQSKEETKDVAAAASDYNKENGRPPVNHEKAPAPKNAKEIADAYDEMKHDPDSPEVKKSYDALKTDVDKQWDYATNKMGVKMEPWTKEGQPYANSKEMMNDVKNNGHLYFFTGGDLPEGHPLADVDPKTGLKYNEKLRAIHDLFGHAANGNSFGPIGEERAWMEHRQMFSPEAVPALTTETRGQNSWVNAGKHLRDTEGNIPKQGEPGFKPPAERPYAENKAGLLPEKFHAPTAKEEANVAEEVTKLHNEGGGSTYNPAKGDMGGKDAYAVPMHPELSKTIEGEKVTPEQIKKFMDDPAVKKAMEADPTLSVGTWANEGKTYLDLSSVMPDREEAIAKGKENNQKAITYLKTREDIPVGGKGTGTPLEEGKEPGLVGNDYKEEQDNAHEMHPLVEEKVSRLSNADLKELGKSYGLNPDEYNFQRREPLREGGQNHPIEREQFVRDLAAAMPEDEKLEIGRQIKNSTDSGTFKDKDLNNQGKAEEAKGYFPKLRDVKAKMGVKGVSPEATAETAKMSNQQLLDAGFTQEQIDAGRHLPSAKGGTPEKNPIPDDISRLLTKQEIDGITKSAKGRDAAVDKLMKLPDVQEFADIALQGEGGRKWYQRSTQAFDALSKALPEYFKEGDKEKFTDLLAAGSPQQTVKMNLQEALKVWTKYIDMGRPEGAPLEKMLKQEFTLPGAKVPNAMKALAGEDLWPDISKNSNFKVPSFAANLRGWLGHVTSDGWQGLFAGIDAKDLSRATSYHPLAVATRAAAEALGWEPAEAQAAIWAFTKAFTEHGEKDPESIKQYSQDFADIIAHDEDIQKQLEELGVDKETLDEHLAKVEPKPEISGRTTRTTEDSIRRLSERIEKAGRDLPKSKDQGNLNFKDTSFDAEDLGEKPSKTADLKAREFKPKRRIRK